MCPRSEAHSPSAPRCSRCPRHRRGRAGQGPRARLPPGGTASPGPAAVPAPPRFQFRTSAGRGAPAPPEPCPSSGRPPGTPARPGPSPELAGRGGGAPQGRAGGGSAPQPRQPRPGGNALRAGHGHTPAAARVQPGPRSPVPASRPAAAPALPAAPRVPPDSPPPAAAPRPPPLPLLLGRRRGSGSGRERPPGRHGRCSALCRRGGAAPPGRGGWSCGVTATVTVTPPRHSPSCHRRRRGPLRAAAALMKSHWRALRSALSAVKDEALEAGAWRDGVSVLTAWEPPKRPFSTQTKGLLGTISSPRLSCPVGTPVLQAPSRERRGEPLPGGF